MSVIAALQNGSDPYLDVDPTHPPVCVTLAEQALLGALLISNRAFSPVADIVAAEDFAWGVHGRIFGAIAARIKTGQPATPVTIGPLFDKDPGLVGGRHYLGELARCAVTVSNAPFYAIIISDCALRRSLIAALEEFEPDKTAVDILRAARPRIVAFANAAARLRNGR